jgi:hypothetical protein
MVGVSGDGRSLAKRSTGSFRAANALSESEGPDRAAMGGQ